jgi:hypothetical protein
VNRLTSTEKALCAFYGLVAVVALVWTQIVLVDYLGSDGNLTDDLFGNGAAHFATVDLLAVAIVGIVFMVVEGRRVGVRFLWVYVLLSFLVAISVAFPLFLIARQVRLAGQRTSSVVE